MTIAELLSKITDEKPNSFGEARLIAFLNEIEADVAEQLKTDPAPVYSVDTDRSTVLLAPAPYDRLYVSYVKAMVDYANEEYASYQNNQAQHNQDFRDFIDYIVRNDLVADEDNMMPKRFSNIF